MRSGRAPAIANSYWEREERRRARGDEDAGAGRDVGGEIVDEASRGRAGLLGGCSYEQRCDRERDRGGRGDRVARAVGGRRGGAHDRGGQDRDRDREHREQRGGGGADEQLVERDDGDHERERARARQAGERAEANAEQARADDDRASGGLRERGGEARMKARQRAGGAEPERDDRETNHAEAERQLIARRAQRDEDCERGTEIRRAADDNRACEESGELAGQRERPHGAARGEQGRRRLAERRREHEHDDAGEPGERILGHGPRAAAITPAAVSAPSSAPAARGGSRARPRVRARDSCEQIVERRGAAVIETRRDHRACG